MTGKLSESSRLESRRVGVVVFVLAVFILLAGSYPLTAVEKVDSGLARYRVFSLRHISAQKGKDYLGQIHLGTVSQLPGANMLLVTGSPQELIKAGAILKLVDAEEQFVIAEISPASLAKDLPSGKQIAAEVGNISIGTFSEPPTGAAQTRAIIDIHNDVVIAVAPAGQLKKIVSVMNPSLANRASDTAQGANREEKPANNKQQATKGKQPVTNDEFFNKLLNSLADAERRAAEPNEQVSRPNEPIIVSIVTKPNEPNAVITVAVPNEPNAFFAVLPEVNVPTEPYAEQLEETELAAILKRLKALEAKIEAQPEPNKPEVITVKEIVTAAIGQPNEVNKPALAAPPYEPEPIPGGNDILSLNLPMTLPITDFLGFMGENLRLDYLYDPVKVKGNVNLRLHGKLKGDIKRKDLYPLLESVLQFNNFVMTRKGNLVIIVPKAEADNIDAPIVREADEKLEHGDVIVTRVFELKHVGTATAQKLLTGMQLGVKITEISEAGTLVVTGYTYRMARIEELLRMIDQPGAPKEFRFRQLRYTMAKTLAPKIKTLVEQLEEEISITVSGAAAASAPVERKKGESTAAYRRRLAAAKRGGPPQRGAPAAKGGKPSVYLDFDERTNRVLMIGYESELDLVEELINGLDVEQQDLRTLRLYEIQNVDAEEVRNKLTELGIISGGKTTTRKPAGKAATPAKGGRPPAAVTSTETPEALMEEPQVVIIEATNSLLVNATPEQHTQIQIIIGYVDSETEATSIPYMIYPLENQDPGELAGVLNQLIRETVTGKDTKGAKIERTTKRIEEDIIIIADAKTYSLIVYASKKNQQWIGSLIKQLDAYRPQVLLDVMLVEVTKSEKFDLDIDIDLLAKLPNLGLTSATGAIEEISATAFYKDRDVDIMLTALQEKGYGRVLARPKLLVNDNEEGIIKTEEQTSVAQVQTKVIPGTAATQSTATQDVSFQSYTAGITLTITPHISKGDQLQLMISLNRTDFRLKDPTKIGKKDDEDIYPTPPDLLTSDVTTNVTVPDGTTIILGGLETIRQSKGGTKVPLLGDIPFVGGLFRTTSNQDDQSRLYVFVKAHILRPGKEFEGLSDIEVVSAKNRATFEKYEREMQEYEDWPGIKPKPMDPLQVLEAD